MAMSHLTLRALQRASEPPRSLARSCQRCFASAALAAKRADGAAVAHTLATPTSRQVRWISAMSSARATPAATTACATPSSRTMPHGSATDGPIPDSPIPDSPIPDSPIPDSPIPIFTTVQAYRQWRAKVAAQGKTVGFVATMGALHEGHMSLVQASLEENDHTVVSIFVNPAQFAPTEDLASYPRTLESDIGKLALLTSREGSRPVSAAFVPSVAEMYPSGFTQIVEDQMGAFVEVKGLAHQMEGGSRPTFFRGVATVVTKLFHIIQPDRAYFGQKDIQQAIVLRRLVKDLLFSHPPSPKHLRVMPTGRDEATGLALSSRNAYLTAAGREVAPILYRALSEGQRTWDNLSHASADVRVRDTLRSARAVVEDEAKRCQQNGNVKLKLDYISLNDPTTLENLEEAIAQRGAESVRVEEGAILSGAALVSEGEDGKVTRLIDNILLGFRL
ncbi:pantoate-beta-alanine ligase [Thecaphora frezii]